MQRHKIILSGHIYIADRFTPGSSYSDIKRNFIMLRKYDYADQMTFDSDVYVIDAEIFEKWKNNELELAFPNTYSNTNINLVTTFSNKIEKYNESFLYNYNDLCPIVSDLQLSNDLYKLADISCDTIRIYHPTTKIKENLLIYIDSYINNIHWHFYCAPISNLEVHSETEFIIENNHYSEYVEFYIPNIEKIFENTYYNDELNNVKNYEDSSHLPLKLLKTHSRLLEEYRVFYKEYVNEEEAYNLDSSRFTNNINITLFPYTGIDETSNIYIMNDEITANTSIFVNEVKFKLSAKFELNQKPILSCNFILPENSIYEDFVKSYEYYNNVKLKDYSDIIYVASEDDDEEIAERFGDIDGQEMKMCGYQLQIATDKDFKNIIYDETNWDNEFDNFSFELNGIFSKWEQYPEVLICRALFIDRYLGNIIYSNRVVITKEHFKYLLDSGRIIKTVEINKNLVPVTIEINEGISKIVVNGMTYRSTITINVVEGTMLNWEAYLKEGYDFTTDNKGKHLTVKDAENVISPEAKKKLVEIRIKIDENIADIVINGETYETDTVIEVEYDTEINWEVHCKLGYVIPDNKYSDSFRAVDYERGYDIEPKAEILKVTVTFYYDTHVKDILINNEPQELDYYEKYLTKEFNYLEEVYWTAVPELGYEILTNEYGYILCEDTQGYTVIISTDNTQCTVQIVVDEGIESITIAKETFTDPISVRTYTYGQKIKWTAKLKKGYQLIDGESLSGIIEVTDFHVIHPMAERMLIKVSIEFNEGISEITLGDVTYYENIELEYPYESEMSWNSQIKEGYYFTSESDGTIKLTELSKIYTISPTAEKIPVQLTLVLDEGVDEIIINGRAYSWNATIDFDWGTEINWEVKLKPGHELYDKVYSDTFTIFEDKEIIIVTYVISIPVKIEINEGISKVTLTQNKIDTVYYESADIEILYGEFVSWKATVFEDHRATSEVNGYFRATDIEGYLISPTAEIIANKVIVNVPQGVKQITIRIVRKDGNVDEAIVTQTSIFDKIIYGEIVYWEAAIEEGYSCNTTSGSFEMKYNDVDITPILNRIKYSLNIILNPGIAYVTVNEVQYRSNAILFLYYGDEIEWYASVKEGYEAVSEMEGSFSITENTEISPKATIIKITTNIEINEGIEYISVNNVRFDENGSIETVYGATIIYEVHCKPGYYVDTFKYTFSATDINGHLISPTAKLLEIPIRIIINQGIEKILVDDVEYTSNRLVYKHYNDSVNWVSTAKYGYVPKNESGEITILNTNGYEISPTVSLDTIRVNIEITEGVYSVTVNDITYYMNETIEVPYFTNIVWEAKTNTGYKFIGESGGSFKVSSDEMYTISPKAKKISVSIKIEILPGIENIKVNGVTYTENASYLVDYDTEIIWIAEIKEGYTCSNISGMFRAYLESGHVIAPEPKILTVPVYVEFDEGIKSITVNETELMFNKNIYYDYGTEVVWKAEPKEGYELTYGEGNFTAIDYAKGYVIRPTAKITNIEIRIIFNEGVKAIHVNGKIYYNDTTIEVIYNTNIVWHAEIEEGYESNNLTGQQFYATDKEGYDIAPIAELSEIMPIVVYNRYMQKSYAVSTKLELKGLNKDEFIPIGIVVVPHTHNCYNENECGVISLKNMKDNSLMHWGNSNADANLNKFDSVNVCRVANDNNVTSTASNGYIPVLDKTNERISADGLTRYVASPYCPSPYTKEGYKNVKYSSTELSSSNALSDFNGKENTKAILLNIGNGATAAYSCSEFYTEGTVAGEWYLGGTGEMGYISARFKYVQNSIDIINEHFGNVASKLSDTNGYWTSTEYSGTTARCIDLSTGYVTSNIKHSLDATGKMTRAFLRWNYVDIEEYNKFNHHAFVDMGEAGIWAVCNIGANSPEESGKYFTFADIIGGTAEETTEGKYSARAVPASSKYSEFDVLDLEDDAARVNMGGNWRIPTKEEYENLLALCDISYPKIGDNNVIMYKLKTDESKQLIIPCGGYAQGNSLFQVNSKSINHCWTSTAFYELHVNGVYTRSKANGYPVRAIFQK